MDNAQPQMPPVVIVRHPKEKLSKCSLEPLRGRPGFTFYKGTERFRYDGTAHLLLAVDAPELSPADAFLAPDEAEAMQSAHPSLLNLDPSGRALRPLLLLDSTWRLLKGLREKVQGAPVERSLPGWLRTAYPRVSKISVDPDAGLASVEALYAALKLMGYDRPEILDDYRWRDGFLRQWKVREQR